MEYNFIDNNYTQNSTTAVTYIYIFIYIYIYIYANINTHSHFLLSVGIEFAQVSEILPHKRWWLIRPKWPVLLLFMTWPGKDIFPHILDSAPKCLGIVL